jgi:ABC-type antimicrobial peptide transport system permease subunit
MYQRSLWWSPSMTVARLKEGRQVSQAAVELAAVKERLLADGNAQSAQILSVKLFRDHITQSFRSDLLVLLGAVGFVVLIACANLANLLLTRGIGRHHELGVRAVVGASRSRLLQQLLTENLLLVILGGVAGLFVAYGGIAFLRSIPFQRVPRLEEAALDGVALLFCLGLLWSLA